jgi:arylsulfatase A-like enzyme
MARTNVLFILTDDQGPWAMGCAGNREIRTPHLDRLAASGARFSHFFCSSPVCSPSRASFLTGRMPSQHGVHDWIRHGNVGDDAVAYLVSEVAYTDVLAANGWDCALSGKWHLGHSQLQQHGFSHWYVHPRGGGEYNNPEMIRDGELIAEQGYVTSLITDDALAYLDRHADTLETASPNSEPAPFYLGVHYTAPHSPWTGHPKSIADSYDDCPFESCPQEPIHPWSVGHGLTEGSLGNREHLQGYFAAVTAMDADVGRLLDKLDDRGLRQDTLVVFVSDNGFSCGHHGFWGKGNGTFPLNMFENSVTVPFLVSQPGRIAPGQCVDGLHNAFDLFPTLLDYLELSPPDDGVDRPGRSFADILDGSKRGDPSGHEAVVVDGGEPGRPEYSEYGASRMVRTGSWKYVDRGTDQPGELYHLKEDPDERANLVDDIGYGRRRDELHTLLQDWFAARVQDSAADGRQYPVSGGGQLRPVVGRYGADTEGAFAPR